jgi:uroporphyrin-III C-methyltransferase
MQTQIGKVYLIGAGPGAKDLMTLRGAHILSKADIVFYDALVEPTMLELCPQAKHEAVGKRCGKRSTAQKFIDKQLVDAALKFKCVVRLKGGDPMIFGRADEELTALKQAGVPVEIVPGVTSALAAAASIQSSLTLRGVSRSVAFLTMSAAPSLTAIECPVQADTMIYYMGKKDSEQIADQLIQQGLTPATPVVVVESISTPRERVFYGRISDLQNHVMQTWSQAEAPAILMIGRSFEKAVATEELKARLHGETDNGLENLIAFSDSRRTA